MKKADMVFTIENAIKGDQTAFEELFNAYWKMAYYSCYKQLRNSQEAEEAAQDAFITLYNDIKKLNSPEAFWSYFSRILVNTCYNRVKSRSYKTSRMNVSIDDFADNLMEERRAFLPEDNMSERTIRAEILKHIDSLPRKQREVMILHYLHELSQSEIAALLNVKSNVIGSRLFLAKKTLKKKLMINTECIQATDIEMITFSVYH